MSVEDRMERTTVGIWRVLAVVVAVALMVNAVQAVAGKAEFAWWHLPTLGIAYILGGMPRLDPKISGRRKAFEAAMAWLFSPESNPDAWMLKDMVVTHSAKRGIN